MRDVSSALVALLAPVLLLVLPPPAPAGEDVIPYRIAAVYPKSDTGLRLFKGAQDALDGFRDRHESPEVVLEPILYYYDQDGVAKLTEAAYGRAYDAILGPAESEIMLRVMEYQGGEAPLRTPVISPLVTADLPDQEGSWFFRTNVNLERRTFTIYDFLNKYWVRSVGLLYSNSAFGVRAEIAFNEQLSEAQRSLYLPLIYQSSGRARAQIRKILDGRPEAVGIFGERSEISDIYASLRQMNPGGVPYRPLIFTIIDPRPTSYSFQDLYFVSISEPPAGTRREATAAPGSTDLEAPASPGKTDPIDDVYALSYDTTVLVLEQLALIPRETAGSLPERRGALRDRLEAALRWGVRLPDTKTPFQLANFENITHPRVMQILAGGAPRPVPLDKTIGSWNKLKMKFALVLDRFGLLPVLNVLLLIAVVIFVSIRDIRKWYAGSAFSLFHPRNYPFYALLWANALIVGALYVYMAETGAIRYDSTLAALVVAVAPLAALRVNFFETAGGKEIGAGRLYESFLQWVNERLMFLEHRETKKIVHLVAYHNSLDGMKSYLKELYRHHRSTAQRIRLEAELEEQVSNQLPYADRRKVCARLLLRTLGWEELQQDGLAPAGSLQEMEDPETVIRRAAQHCAGNAEAKKTLREEIDRHLANIGDTDRRKDLEAALLRDLLNVVGEQGRLRRRIAFLFVLRGYDVGYLGDILGIPSGPDIAPAAAA